MWSNSSLQACVWYSDRAFLRIYVGACCTLGLGDRASGGEAGGVRRGGGGGESKQRHRWLERE